MNIKRCHGCYMKWRKKRKKNYVTLGPFHSHPLTLLVFGQNSKNPIIASFNGNWDLLPRDGHLSLSPYLLYRLFLHCLAQHAQTTRLQRLITVIGLHRYRHRGYRPISTLSEIETPIKLSLRCRKSLNLFISSYTIKLNYHYIIFI